MNTIKTIPGVGGRRYVVRDEAGHELGEGDTVSTFRGEEAQLLSIAAAPVPGKSAKVTTTIGTHYAGVYDVTVAVAPPGSLTEVMQALQNIASAAKDGCLDEYRAAIAQGISVGTTDAQLHDAYLRGRKDLGPVNFDYLGRVWGDETDR
ncbi:MAG: hypothetical protein JSS74_04055 [Actinobacteria bacterium]|nr:hypothetical protein [Actinomycetota bacterium]